jgi:hypothetical protein
MGPHSYVCWLINHETNPNKYSYIYHKPWLFRHL